jgi:hypothetical protein
VVEPPSREAILHLRAWLADAALPDPPLKTMPGVEAYDARLPSSRVLAEPARLALGVQRQDGHPPVIGDVVGAPAGPHVGALAGAVQGALLERDPPIR